MSDKDYTAAEANQLKWYKQITVEPPMFLYMMAYMITNVVEQAFYVHKACTVNHGYNLDTCNNLKANITINNEVQVTVSNFHQWNGIASHVVPLFLAFFLGAWSDKYGRKSILLAGFLGKTYFSFMAMINTIKPDWPVEYMIYSAALPSALTGADLAIFAGCFAYISDVTTVSQRTLRVGILDAVYLSTMPTGVALGSFLFSKVVNESYTVMFAINTFFMLLATSYTLFFLKWQTTPKQKSLKEAGVSNPITEFFDMEHVRSSFRTLLKKRSSHKRLYLWFFLIAMALYTFQRDERPMMYLYTYKVFGWTTVEFSNFRTYLSTIYVLTMLIGIPLMTRIFKWRDTVIIMLGATSHIMGHAVYAAARAPWVMYLGATLAALGPCVAPLIRSMTSKILEPSERGIAFAFLSVAENTVALFASILYTQLYNATVTTDYPNAIFFLTISTQVIVFIFGLTIQIFLRDRTLEELLRDETNVSASCNDSQESTSRREGDNSVTAARQIALYNFVLSPAQLMTSEKK